MTLLVSWVAVDTHGTSSIYVVSDSRIVWPRGATYERGRKVFAFANHPDILGYCGDVLFPSLALNQLVAMGDAGLLFEDDQSPQEKFELLARTLSHLQKEYPETESGFATNALRVVHASRGGNGKFHCNLLTWSSKSRWTSRQAVLPKCSDVIFTLGTGAAEFDSNYKRYKAGQNRDTSRAVYHCFCDTLRNTKEKSVGGAPQLVGLYRKPQSSGRHFGSIFKGNRYFLGVQVNHLRSNSSSVQWRNENFEITDGQSMNAAEQAQRQPDPLRRK